MEVIPLQSGSSGNCVYVESDDVRLLFDAGISGRKAQQRLELHGKDIHDVDALIISHDHSDHIQSMGVFNRKFALPIYLSEPTLRFLRKNRKLGELSKVNCFDSGHSFRIGHVTIETLKTPHDAVDGVAFVVDDGEKRFGLLTDLGHVFVQLEEVIPTLDAVVLESNYDDQMLIDSRYPDLLKTRIAGKGGHISNLDAAELLRSASPELQWAILAHLSEECNDPETALQTHRRVLGRGLNIQCADRYEASPLMRIASPKSAKSAPRRMVQPRLFV